MTKNRRIASELYAGIHNKEHVSEEFLYDSLCFFGIAPERVVQMLNELPSEICDDLSIYFHNIRMAVKRVMDNSMNSDEAMKESYDPEMEDTLYYDLMHNSVNNVSKNDVGEGHWYWKDEPLDFLEIVRWALVLYKLSLDQQNTGNASWDKIESMIKMRETAYEYGMTQRAVANEMVRVGREILQMLDIMNVKQDMQEKLF